MARPRRRIKLQPFRMGEKFRNTVLVGLGVFLMAIFAVPFQGSCQRHRVGGRSPNEVYFTMDGRAVRFGEVIETMRLWRQVFRMPLTEEQAALQLGAFYQAERAGIRVSDAEVVEAIRSRVFPSRAKVEYVIAEHSAFGKDAAVSDKELQDAYDAEKEKRFKNPDGTYRPLSEVRESLESEVRAKKGAPLAIAALEKLKKTVDELVGAPLENALKQLAADSPMRFGETRVFTPRTAQAALRPIGDIPGIAELVFRQRIGELSNPTPLTGAHCVFRVVSRSRGFGPDGRFRSHEEGWVRQGYGTINVKDYDELLREMGVTEADLETAVRRDLALVVLPTLYENAASSIPRELARARYQRDNTQALPAYFALRAADFAQGVTYTEDDLRDFYARHKDRLRTKEQPGYRQPERVRIEYVLGRTSDIAEKLTDTELFNYYQRNSAFFGPSYKDAQADVRKRLAEEKLQNMVVAMANRAADAATRGQEPNLRAIAAEEARGLQEAFRVAASAPFAAGDEEQAVPELRGGKLADALFGERGQQYAVAGQPHKPGTHPISEVFACDAGRFFFRVLQREPSRDIPYDALPPDLREQLKDDVVNDKAFAQARLKAAEYRTKVYQAAFERFAEALATKPLTTEFLRPADPLPALGQTVPELYDQLIGGEVGDLSDVAAVGDRFVLARLDAREEAKGLRLQIVLCDASGLGKAAYEPSLYEVRAAYDATPHAYLDPPTPIPFEKVQDDIRRLLARRQALAVAAERAEKALAELVAKPMPELAEVAKKHSLLLQMGVAVNPADPSAAPGIGKAAGFAEALAALAPGDVSRILVSAEGRFIFVLKARTDKAATIDVLAAPYAPLVGEAKIDDADVRKHYDQHRDTAYVTGDEIRPAPSWEAVSQAVRDRARKALQDAWAKKAPGERLAALRDSLVSEAMRTVPPRAPLAATRAVRIVPRTLGPFPASKPEGPLANEPEAVAALRALEPGQLSKPLPIRRGALLALLTDRRPGGLARAKVALFRGDDAFKTVPEPTAAAIDAYFAANKAALKVPAQAELDYIFADIASRQRALLPTLEEADCRRYYEERSSTLYLGDSYEAAEARVRTDLARERASRAAREAAERALEALRKEPKPAEANMAPLAEKFGLATGRTEPFALEDPASPAPLGRIRDIADELRDAQPGHVVPRVVESSLGFSACRLAARTPEREPQLAEVRDRIVGALKLQAARETIRKAAEAFRAAAEATSFDKAAAAAAGAPRIIETGLLDARHFNLPGEDPAPTLARAIYALDKPGLTPVVEEESPPRAFVALVTTREPDELLTLEAATLDSRQLMLTTPEEPTEDELRKHYEANLESFRRPETVEAEALAADYERLAKALPAPSEDELRNEYQRSVDAGEPAYRDRTADGPAYLPFNKARHLVEQKLRSARARTQADALMAEARRALLAEGPKADLSAYAAKHPPLVAMPSEGIDRERKGMEPIGSAPELAAVAFAAKKGDIAGPVKGADGVCLLRILDVKPSAIPPFEDVRFQVEVQWRRRRDSERAVAAAAKVHERLAAALAQPEAKVPALAFRKALEGEPISIEVQLPVTVTLSRPVYPQDAGHGRSSFITGLGEEPRLVAAVFRQRPGHLTAVVESEERLAAYVALLVQFIPPKAPSESELFTTQYRLADITRQMVSWSWHRHLDSLMRRD